MPHRNRVHLTHDGRVVAFPGWVEQPGLIHGTTTRAALASAPPFDLFRAVAELREGGVLPRRPTLGGEQVHGDHVARLTVPIAFGSHPPGFRWEQEAEVGEFAATDALVTSIPGVLLAIRTADCLPVLLLDRPARVTGVAHCGWKGTLAGLAARTAEAMIELGAAPSRLEAWIGPGIRTMSYEVGGDLIARFQQKFPEDAVSPDGTHLNLGACVAWQLEEAGLLHEHIFDSWEDTLERQDRYFSYRGEGATAGRMVSFIGLAPDVDL